MFVSTPLNESKLMLSYFFEQPPVEKVICNKEVGLTLPSN